MVLFVLMLQLGMSFSCVFTEQVIKTCKVTFFDKLTNECFPLKFLILSEPQPNSHLCFIKGITFHEKASNHLVFHHILNATNQPSKAISNARPDPISQVGTRIGAQSKTVTAGYKTFLLKKKLISAIDLSING